MGLHVGISGKKHLFTMSVYFCLQGVTLTDLKEAEKTLGMSTEKKTQEQLERREEVKENEGKKERSSLSEDKVCSLQSSGVNCQFPNSQLLTSTRPAT